MGRTLWLKPRFRVRRKSASLINRKNHLPEASHSPVNSILFLQRTVGNQAVQGLLKSAELQTKLKIGQPGDKYEQEADRVADKIMQMPEPVRQGETGSSSHSQPPHIQRLCPECKEELRQQPMEEEKEEKLRRQPAEEEKEVELKRQPVEEEKEEELQRQPVEEEKEEELRRQPADEEQNEELQRQPVEKEKEEELQRQPEEEEEIQAKGIPGKTSGVNQSLGSRINSLRSSGQKLPESVRAFFEPRMGQDFSHVRVHTDEKASETAQAVNARAFTVGKDVVFGSGQYAPETEKGKRLIAHELIHVMQQTSLLHPYPEEGVNQRPTGSGRSTGGRPQCGCSPIPTSLCSRINAGGRRTRQDVVFEAFQMAAGWLPGAKQATEDYINSPPSHRSNQRAAVPFRDHFRWPPSGTPIGNTPNIMLGVINRLFTNITYPICPNCQPQCPCSGRHPSACSPNAWHNTNCYEFCDPFFLRANSTLRAKIVIHEMMHSWEQMGDIAYEGDSDYPPNHVTARANADSYASFIRDLR